MKLMSSATFLPPTMVGPDQSSVPAWEMEGDLPSLPQVAWISLNGAKHCSNTECFLQALDHSWNFDFALDYIGTKTFLWNACLTL